MAVSELRLACAIVLGGWSLRYGAPACRVFQTSRREGKLACKSTCIVCVCLLVGIGQRCKQASVMLGTCWQAASVTMSFEQASQMRKVSQHSCLGDTRDTIRSAAAWSLIRHLAVSFGHETRPAKAIFCSLNG